MAATGDEVLDIVLEEMNVSPAKVSLAHSDPSGKDVAYQRKMLDRGVWLEFDMIGLDITFPKKVSRRAFRRQLMR